jgi:hypothetical protein
MDPAVSTVRNIDGAVNFTFNRPYDGSAAITSYKIEFLAKDGSTWITNTAYCDGSSAIFISIMSCVVPMSVFINIPLNL